MSKRLGVVETMSCFVFRPVSFYAILQYVYAFFDSTFPPFDGNRCHSLNRLAAYRKPDPSLSLSPFSKLLFRGSSHLPRRAGAPHPARHAGDYDPVRPRARDPGVQCYRFSPFQRKGLALYVRVDAYARRGGPGVCAAIARKPEVTRL